MSNLDPEIDQPIICGVWIILLRHYLPLTLYHQFSGIGESGAVPLLGGLFKPGGFVHTKIVGGFITDKA